MHADRSAWAALPDTAFPPDTRVALTPEMRPAPRSVTLAGSCALAGDRYHLLLCMMRDELPDDDTDSFGAWR